MICYKAQGNQPNGSSCHVVLSHEYSRYSFTTFIHFTAEPLDNTQNLIEYGKDANKQTKTLTWLALTRKLVVYQVANKMLCT